MLWLFQTVLLHNEVHKPDQVHHTHPQPPARGCLPCRRRRRRRRPPSCPLVCRLRLSSRSARAISSEPEIRLCESLAHSTRACRGRPVGGACRPERCRATRRLPRALCRAAAAATRDTHTAAGPPPLADRKWLLVWPMLARSFASTPWIIP
jgi:hypothetical protein